MAVEEAVGRPYHHRRGAVQAWVESRAFSLNPVTSSDLHSRL